MEILQQQAARCFGRERTDERNGAFLVAVLERKWKTELVLYRQLGNVLNGRVPAAPDMHAQNPRLDIGMP